MTAPVRPTVDSTTADTAALPTASAQPTPANARSALLITEARQFIRTRKWTAAIKTLEAAKRLDPDADTDEIDELLIVANSYGGRRRARKAAERRLQQSDQASSWVARGTSKLARFRFDEADSAARKAIEIEPTSSAAWRALGASYAGLGWFAEAEECLQTADRTGRANELETWQLGRCINRWAMTQSYGLSVALLVVILGGFKAIPIAIALGATTPFLIREFRVARLEQQLRTIADDTWVTQHRLRFSYGLLVLVCTAAWTVVLAASAAAS